MNKPLVILGAGVAFVILAIVILGIINKPSAKGPSMSRAIQTADPQSARPLTMAQVTFAVFFGNLMMAVLCAAVWVLAKIIAA